MSDTDYLFEEVKTIKNLAEIVLLVYQMNRKDLIPTILEILHEHTQDIVEEYCVVKEIGSITFDYPPGTLSSIK